MTGNITSVSVIIPTLADTKRSDSIKRAIESIRNASTEPTQIIVVVNGNRFDTNVCNWLKSQSDVLFAQIETGSLPLAQKRGRELVGTEYFSFLDDDDEYLPQSLDQKISSLLMDTTADFVISNGFKRINGLDEPFYPNIEAITKDPLSSLFERNWLASCGVLFRSSTVGQSFFDDPHPYAEWTWLAYNLLLTGKKLNVISDAGFRIHDTPGSLSKSDPYRECYFSLYERMLKKQPPKQIEDILKARIGAAYHDKSVSQLAKREWLSAVASHFKSLTYPKGLRYLSYTRRLLPFWPKTSIDH
jgi:glycosyltransferase involved in cell wall biosynthesis